MTARIVIQHLTGSKANQIEQFPLEGFSELTIGRDPASTIAFDAQRDDLVSRRHAVIRIEPGEPPRFKITDLQSRNGTHVNGTPISGETELLPGDTVELGPGGPKFAFDLQPRPANVVPRTRVMPAGGGATRILSTAEIEAAAAAATTNMAQPPPKTGIGRNTVIGMLAEQREKTNRTWMYVLAGVLLLVAIGGGGLYYNNKVKTEAAAAAAAAELARQAAELDKQKAVAAAAQQQQLAALEKQRVDNERALAAKEQSIRADMGMSPEEIAQKYGNATVVVEVQWRLYDKASGKPLFQKMFRIKDGRKVPGYVKVGKEVFRWLTTDDENGTNQVIGGAGQGSGFVISEQGFILTNKHVAAGWMTGYGQHEGYDVGLLFDYAVPKQKPTEIDVSDLSSNAARDLYNWVPDSGPESRAPVFRADVLTAVDEHLHSFEGRSDMLEVRFPGNTLSVSAKLVRASTVADVAEIKIDTQQSLQTVDLPPSDDVRVGQKVTVLGYPGFSTQTIALIKSVENGQFHQHVENVPAPTVTAGLISKKGSSQQQVGVATTVMSDMGEVYQLTAATGAGNSGGPVFNDAGKVIGIFTYGSRTRETQTFAIPIKFGLDLLRVQGSN